MNKITKFKDSDSSSDEDNSSQPNDQNVEKSAEESEESLAKKQNDQNVEKSVEETEESPVKKQRVEGNSSNCKNIESDKAKDKCIDDLIEDELKELGNRNKVWYYAKFILEVNYDYLVGFVFFGIELVAGLNLILISPL